MLREPCGALLVALLSTLCLSSGLAAGPRVLELGDSNDAPFTDAAGTGFFDVIATEAFRRAGLELRVVRLPAERGLLLADQGILDGELARTGGIAKQYRNLIPVPEILFERHYAAFSKDASIPGSTEAIRARKVGLVRGWKIFEQAMAGAPDVVRVGSPEQMFRLLQLDRIEVALYGRAMGLTYLRSNGITNVADPRPSLFIRELYIYLHKSHAGQLPALAAALRAMKLDGFYRRSYTEDVLSDAGQDAQ